MPTNRFPDIGYKNQGYDFNFFEKKEITTSTFGGDSVGGKQPDMIITFPTQNVTFLIEESSGVIEYSFNGNTVHGELDATQLSKSLTFEDRVISMMWFRVKQGSTGPLTLRVEAWGTR